MSGSALTLTEEGGCGVRLDEDGSLRITSSVTGAAGRQRGMFAIIDEEIRGGLTSSLTFGSWLLEKIDPIQRITHVAIAVQLTGGEHMPWMTQSEASASNGSYSMGMGIVEKTPVRLMLARAVLRLDRTHLVDDLLVLLRRQWPNRLWAHGLEGVADRGAYPECPIVGDALESAPGATSPGARAKAHRRGANFAEFSARLSARMLALRELAA